MEIQRSEGIFCEGFELDESQITKLANTTASAHEVQLCTCILHTLCATSSSKLPVLQSCRTSHLLLL